MIAKLLVREQGQREFVQQNGDFTDDPLYEYPEPREGQQKAYSEGERLCSEGNVEAFQIWTLNAAYERKWVIKEMEDA